MMPDNRARGSDVSIYQYPERMLWPEWVGLGIVFAIYRAGIGEVIDEHSRLHRARMRAAGMLTGAYWALHERVSPALQARLLHRELAPDDELGGWADIERAALLEWMVIEFITEWNRISSRPIGIYTSAPSWHDIVGRGPRAYAVGLRLWVAGYPFDTAPPKPVPMDAASVALRSTPPLTRLPALPDPWRLANRPYVFWQHTGQGSLPGYGGKIDLNVFPGTLADLRREFGVLAGPPPLPSGPFKLAPHILGTSGEAMALARDARAPVVKLVDDFGAADAYAALPHHPLIIGRVHVDPELRPDDLQQRGADPLAHAASYYQTHYRARVLTHRAIRAWEGPNEPVTKTIEAVAWYAVFEAERVRLLAADGALAVVGNWSTGQPEPELWPAFAPALDAIRARGGYLGLHEYSEPSRGYDGFYMGRFEKAPRDVPKIITEMGTDSIPPVIDPATGAIIHPAGAPWRDQFAGDAGGVDAYAAFLIAYNERLMAAPDIVGATIFTYGQGWPTHNVEDAGLTARLIAYADGLSKGSLSVVHILFPDNLPPEIRAAISKHLADMAAHVGATGSVYPYGPPNTPGPWYASLPDGVTFATPIRAKSKTDKLPVYRQPAPPSYSIRTVNPATYQIDVHRRQGEWLQVTASGSVWINGADALPG